MGRNYQSEATRNGNKQHFENLLFIIFKKGTPRKRAGCTRKLCATNYANAKF